MSNVLLGIIGVIVFIGLALAGALLLGSSFMEASSTSKAAIVTQQLGQIAAAITMYQVRTGRTMLASDDNATLLQPRFLRTFPAANPVNGGTYRLNDAGGNDGPTAVRMVITPLGADSRAKDVCSAIEEQSGTSAPDMSPKTDFAGTVAAKGAGGCFLYGPNANYYAVIGV